MSQKKGPAAVLTHNREALLFLFAEILYHLIGLIFIRNTDSTRETILTVGLLIMNISTLTPSMAATRRIAKQVLTREAARQSGLLNDRGVHSFFLHIL